MSLGVHEFDWPDRAVIGTIGRPGERTFYLQVRAGSRLASVVMEKQQAAVLAEKIDEILDQLATVEGNPFSVPAGTPPELVDNDGLEADSDLFRCGTMGLGGTPAPRRWSSRLTPSPTRTRTPRLTIPWRRTPHLGATCCCYACPWAPRAPSPDARVRSWAPDVPPARCAVTPWTPMGTPA